MIRVSKRKIEKKIQGDFVTKGRDQNYIASLIISVYDCFCGGCKDVHRLFLPHIVIESVTFLSLVVYN